MKYLLFDCFCFTDDNQIKFMDGEMIKGMGRLVIVDLLSNSCIDQYSEGESQIAILSQTVTKKCSTNWTEMSVQTTLSSVLQDRTTYMSNQAQANAAIAEIQEALESKMRENSELLNKLQLKDSEIDQKNQKIENLENTIKYFEALVFNRVLETLNVSFKTLGDNIF